MVLRKVVPTGNWDESGLVELDEKGEDLLEVAEEAARLFEQGVEGDAVGCLRKPKK